MLRTLELNWLKLNRREQISLSIYIEVIVFVIADFIFDYEPKLLVACSPQVGHSVCDIREWKVCIDRLLMLGNPQWAPFGVLP